MNAACMFWDNNGNKTLSYNPESRNWKAISTEGRICKGTCIYNLSIMMNWHRLKKEYGENAKGTVSYQQIQSDIGSEYEGTIFGQFTGYTDIILHSIPMRCLKLCHCGLQGNKGYSER